MKTFFLHWSAFILVAVTWTFLSAGCIMPYGGYGYDDGGVGYYEPYGIDYGGWGPGYNVAPYRGGHGNGGEYRSGGGGHAYRSAPASRSMPSLPNGGHGGSRSHR
jgi:hypothetical protein